MSLPPKPVAELRTNTHQQMLVDVGIVLEKAYGSEYAKSFLDEMNIPASVVQRVLTQTGLRPMTHCNPPR
jgi:hypothetical protein